ncbi:MAG: TonB-dependent receptor [Bacteroidaceae bacterium]|nr:TonB-dependent receptor [Bacteroidaceae bacterium]
MKAMIMLISMLLVQGMAMADNRINGRIVDDKDVTPLVGVTVVLFDSSNEQVKGGITDLEGRFELKEVEAGDYVLQCSYVGYEPFTIVLKQLERNMDLGEIRLRSASEMLDEVVVQGEKIVQKVDRQLIMPTSAQKKASTNGVSLLQHLQLPGLTINAIEKSITTNYGESVQLRINGVEVTQAEVIAIRPEDVIRVEYHEQAGLRYGGVPAVVDYIVRRRESGGNVSADLTNAVSPLGFGNYQMSGKYHRGKSSFTALMQWSRRDLEWNRENEETFYFPDKTITNRETVASPNNVKYDYITTSLNYNYTNGEKSMLNIAFRNNTQDIPHGFTDRNSILHQEDKEYEVKDRESVKTVIPSLDVYYQMNLKNGQYLYFDVVGTYLGSDNQRTYSMTERGQTPVEIYSKTQGDKYSIIGEAIYERPLGGGKFTTGLKHNQATMDNEYDGDEKIKVSMNTAETSFFSEYQSKVGMLNYTLGIGVLRTFYRQGEASQEKYFFRPTLNLSYSLGKVYLRYNASLSGYAPSLSALSNVEQAMDAYQVRRGNPNLNSVTYFTNRISASYRNKWMNLDLSTRYSYDDKPIMEETIYEDGKFVRTYDNQRGLHRLMLQASLQFRPFKEYLSINLTPYLNRYISQGNAYTHTHSNWGFRGSIVGMYKQWIFMADMNTSYHDLEGETITKGEAIHSIALGYKKEKWALQGMVMNPFTRDYHQGKENVSRLAPNKQLAFSRDLCPMFMLNVSFNLSFGKQKQMATKRIDNSDKDTGILTGTK